MRRFAALYAELDRTSSTLAKREAIVTYLRHAPPADAAWAAYVLGGGKLRRLAKSGELRQALAEATGYADWLIDESYEQVGDLAETIALMLPAGDGKLSAVPLQNWMEERLPELGRLASDARIKRLQAWWAALLPAQVFLLNKLITGSLRVGVSHKLVVQAIAHWSGQPTDLIAHRMSGDWRPSADALNALAQPPGEDEHLADRPYPFFLASPLEHEVHTLGERDEWLAEWKWDGIRAQLMRRGDSVDLWSRGEERLDGRFPEIERAAFSLPAQAVLDGEVLAWDAVAQIPLVFTALQRRIGKLKPGPKLLADAPVRFMAYDVLEHEGIDLREQPLHARRALLARLLTSTDPSLILSPAITSDSWSALTSEREQSRVRQTEGLMLKRLDSPYRVGRKRGDWWKWKVDPHTLDAVLLYAQPGHGRRSGLFTDYSFGVWDGEALVTVAKAYSGLDDEEIGKLDRWIRAHTTERFGPVRAVEPVHVFELAFEAVQLSGRHKSGVAVRFPRIVRWRTDKGIGDADKLDDLRRLASG
ncbi:ATP-dependent DNA ligase [Rhodanobacter sp. AS-Z3]|uniref:ATP-dependent DNA ligase n=1 Tax=Rhodanobacter sp. AS-Z3 TaxID=3031330 RepID=UPI00247B1BFB|nr:ATP-dependent DNA ligase [Rhodanobacter sp. AS-Z3]WEN13970.1 ATP-dependent DNA ligase [Rhodanobacter sp. AS-Z3]